MTKYTTQWAQREAADVPVSSTSRRAHELESYCEGCQPGQSYCHHRLPPEVSHWYERRMALERFAAFREEWLRAWRKRYHGICERVVRQWTAQSN